MADWEKIICTYKRINVNKIERNSPAGAWRGKKSNDVSYSQRNKCKWPMTT